MREIVRRKPGLEAEIRPRRSTRDKIFLAAEIASSSALFLYALSTIALLAKVELGDAGASALDTLRMSAITGAVFVGDKISRNN